MVCLEASCPSSEQRCLRLWRKARAGETNGQWSTKVFHHFSLKAINNPHVHADPGIQAGSFCGFLPIQTKDKITEPQNHRITEW